MARVPRRYSYNLDICPLRFAAKIALTRGLHVLLLIFRIPRLVSLNSISCFTALGNAAHMSDLEGQVELSPFLCLKLGTDVAVNFIAPTGSVWRSRT